MIKVFIPKKDLVKKIQAYYEEVNHYHGIKVQFDCQVHTASLMEQPLWQTDYEWTSKDFYTASVKTKVSGTLNDRNQSKFSHEIELCHLKTVMEHNMNDDVYDIAGVDYDTHIYPRIFSNQKVGASVRGLTVYLEEKDTTNDISSGKVIQKRI